MKREQGFTLIELLVVMTLMLMVTAGGTVALRQYFQVRALKEAQGTITTELRKVQQRSTAEGYPNAYGVRFHKGTSQWYTVRYVSTTGVCTVVGSRNLESGMAVAADTGTQFPVVAGTSACRSASPGGSSDSQVVFFYPSGTAVAGTVKLEQQALGRSRSLSVSALTGRVTRL